MVDSIDRMDLRQATGAISCALLAFACASQPSKQPWQFDPRPTEPVAELCNEPHGEPPVYGIDDQPGQRDVASGGGLQGTAAAEEVSSGVTVVDDGPITLDWPLPATGITSLFGNRKDPLNGRTRFHYGVDLEGRYGQVIKAAAAGTVIYSGWRGDHGRMVILEHGIDVRTSYSHLAQVLVPTGAVVEAGQDIGRLGNSGRSTGPHLHFEVVRRGAYLDPLEALAGGVSY